MIYVKDYQALNDLVNPCHSLRKQLLSLIGKPVTVFVDGGGAASKGFTGILIEVLPDCIKLITALPSKPGGNKKECDKFGTYTAIAIGHITALQYSYT